MDAFQQLPDGTNKAKAQEVLGAYLAEPLTAICLVFGTSTDAEVCVRQARRVGTDAEDRVVWVPDPTVLEEVQRTEWRPTEDIIATFLNSSDPRRVSCALPAAQATKSRRLMSAFIDALAGRVAK